ncbi:hypothetical protein ACSTJG_24905 [Vibrio parahaemolyticus]
MDKWAVALTKSCLILNAMKYTQSTLDKLEDILGESDYVVRYERGTFQSGWCFLEAKKIVVLNKFLDVEGRINTMMELIPQLVINYDKLTLESQKLYDEVIKKTVTTA